MDISEFKVTFDGILQNYVDAKIQQTKKLLDNDRLNKFIDYIGSFIFSGGKRIRPYCLRLAYKGFGGENEKAILNFGIIFELLHTMALIHDDIIDQSEKRHNASTMHQFINSILGTGNMHIAESQAILVGDLLLSWVYELWFKNHDFSEPLLYSARQNVHNMIEEVILGQMIDVNMMTGEPANSKMIDKKNKYKTASYTFIRPMLTGAILADADEKQKNLIIDLGENLGLAFQVKDDLFDITFQDKTKSPFSDIQEGQQTYFTNYIFQNGNDQQKEILKSCMGRKLSDDEILNLQNIFQSSGAIDFGKELIKKYSDKAQSILDQIKFSNVSSQQEIAHLINKISTLKI
ncbi:MAG: polyprenyl synthetase family protein [Candidatus Absconditabacterales bacterium]